MENLIDRLLVEQQSLTAVERFAQRHADHDDPLQARYYRDLIPLTAPAPGQQFAFEVNLDRCTGCKACVSACHSLNGLEEHESWRDTGVLLGYVKGSAYQQTVTSACHHCLEPGCLGGCPVAAYEKDSATGIVRHLDDQCIGCQYCTMKCPYDVPKFSKRLGIVRKCDMCHDRLAVGEAPACVQACPHEAIRIRVVDTAEVRAASSGTMLPGTFAADYTKPATSYITSRAVPPDAQPADAGTLRKEHAHWPLIVMLVLTQVATGMLVVLGLAAFVSPPDFARLAFPVSTTAFLVLSAGLGASVLHLGRPLGAWRFFLGLRTSWMSREILAFGLFAAAAFPAVVAAWFHPGWTLPVQGVALLGLAAVWTSCMIYADTHRAFWRLPFVMTRFFGAVLYLGAGGVAVAAAWRGASGVLPLALGIAAAAQAVAFAAEMARHDDALKDSDHPNHRSARVVDVLLRGIVPARAVLCLAALALLAAAWAHPTSFAPAAFVTLLAGAIAERYVFFTAVVAYRMPGGHA